MYIDRLPAIDTTYNAPHIIEVLSTCIRWPDEEQASCFEIMSLHHINNEVIDTR